MVMDIQEHGTKNWIIYLPYFSSLWTPVSNRSYSSAHAVHYHGRATTANPSPHVCALRGKIQTSM